MESKRIKKFILILICLVILTVIVIYNMKNSINYKKEIIINVGDKLPSINNYVIKKDITSSIKWNQMKIENDKIYYSGIYTGIFNYNGKNYKVKLIVKDNVAPTIDNVKDIEINLNDKINLIDSVEVKDNSHDIIKKAVIGNYDTSKEGTYKLTYVATDKSNNTTKKKFKLIVKKNSNTSPTTSKGYKIEKINNLYYINGILIVNKTYPLPETYNPGGLTKEFNEGFNKLVNAAKKDGISLWIKSGFRSYETQKSLYNRYAARDGYAAADRYSARAGYSEHQSGLAADFNEISNTFGESAAGKWLANNCWKYGFILRFPKGKEQITGYMYESWHFRYIGNTKITKEIYNNGNWLTLEEYLGIDSKYK